jgi:purine-binding chemotaxis protein CheW
MNVPTTAAQGWYSPYVQKTAAGNYTFTSEIKEMILFEYHDFLNTTGLAVVDLIFSRDVLAFLSSAAKKTVLNDFAEKIKGNGIVIIGENESIAKREPWRENLVGSVTVYSK